MEWLIVPALLGLLPAAIARARGLDFATWWLYGALIWPVALVHVFFAKPGSVSIIGRPTPTRTCPFCAETIQAEARVCKHCSRDLPAPVTTTAVPRARASAAGSCARCGRPIFPNSVRCGFCSLPIGAR